MGACTSSHKGRIWCQPMNTRRPRATFKMFPDDAPWHARRNRRMGRRPLLFSLLMALLLLLSACGGNSGAGWGPGSTAGNASTQHIVDQDGLIIFAPPTLQPSVSALLTAFAKARHLSIPYTFN